MSRKSGTRRVCRPGPSGRKTSWRCRRGAFRTRDVTRDLTDGFGKPRACVPNGDSAKGGRRIKRRVSDGDGQREFSGKFRRTSVVEFVFDVAGLRKRGRKSISETGRVFKKRPAETTRRRAVFSFSPFRFPQTRKIPGRTRRSR